MNDTNPVSGAEAAPAVRTPSDNALTPAEAYKMFKDGKLTLRLPVNISEEDFSKKFSEISPVTPKAIKTLETQGLRYHPTLRRWLVTQAKTDGRQLNDEAAQAVKVRWNAVQEKENRERQENDEKYHALLDLQPDTSFPGENGKETCFVCKTEFTPMKLYLVRDGRRVPSKIAGGDVIIGNFKVGDMKDGQPVDAGQGEPTITGTCKECGPVSGGESHTYGDAIAIRDQMVNDRASFSDKADRAAALRRSLLGRNGEARFQGGTSAAEDVARAAAFMESRRSKWGARGGRGRDRR